MNRGMGNHFMAKELYEAAVNGKEEELDKNKGDERYLSKKTSEGNNILHISIQFGKLSFAKKVVSMYPRLMWEENKDSNNPLHFAAELRDTPNIDGGVLESIVKDACQRLVSEGMERLRKKNFKGNTALHLAIIHGRLEVAHVLLTHDSGLARIVNDYEETPLHLVFKHFPHLVQSPDDDMEEKKEKFMSLIEQKTEEWKRNDGVTVVEKMAVMIRMLLAISSEVASRKDVNGLTPLHLATGIPFIYNLLVIQHIIKCYPQSIEVYDNKRKTILHHLINRIQYVPQGENFLANTLVHSLKDNQDIDGNTPFHLSIIHKDNVMVKLLYYIFKADTFVKNNKGESPISLLVQDNYKVLHAEKMMTEEVCRRAEYGDVFALEEHLVTFGSRFFESLDSNGRNVIHKLFLIKSGNIIIPNELLNFITNHKQVLKSLRKPDNNGDTPIHILARLNPNNIMIYLGIASRLNPTYTEELYPGPTPNDPKCFSPSYQKYTYAWEKLGTSSILEEIIMHCTSVLERDTIPQNTKGNTTLQKAIMAQNNKGNTTLHEAIIAQNYGVFVKLVEFCKGATALVNHRNETLLHLLAPLNPTSSIIENVLLDDIIKDNTKDEQHFCNEDGMSPLAIAIQHGNIEFAERLVFHCPKLAEVKSPKGQTFWHQLVNVPPAVLKSFEFEKNSFAKKDVLELLSIKDNDENTALHLAIEQRQFDVAQLFLSLQETSTLLHVPNKEGDTPGDMIGSIPYLPKKFEKFIWKDSTLIGTRSIWGIPTTQMKEYVNTMGVIAALLTTITFTAAFTVPGGLDQKKGTPLLIKEPAFKVFIISDVLAMCLSMMVLFCLLWIMATGDKSKSVVLLDFSIILLLASFYTTLLTFMTGLYATLHHVEKRIAIFSLIPCSMLLLLVHKYLVIKLVIPSGKLILILVDKVSRSVKDAFQYANDSRKRCMSFINVCYPRSSSSMPMQHPSGDRSV